MHDESATFHPGRCESPYSTTFIEIWPSRRSASPRLEDDAILPVATGADRTEPDPALRREAGEPPLAVLFVEARERRLNDAEGRLFQAELDLAFHLVSGPQTPPGDQRPLVDCWSAAYRRSDGRRSDGRRSDGGGELSLLGPVGMAGARFLDFPGLKGHRIGTYLMDRLVAWACQWPDATLQTISLSADQATPENHARRNRFYEQFGIPFVWLSDRRDSGYSAPIKCRQLTRSDAWNRNIREVGVWSWTNAAMADLARYRAEADRSVVLEAELERLRAERREERLHPFRHLGPIVLQRARYRLMQISFLLLGLAVALAAVWTLVRR